MNTPIMTDEEQAAAFLAWKHGKAIQWWSEENKDWRPTPIGHALLPNTIIRPKPTPKLRPFKHGELLPGVLLMYEGNPNDWHIITDISDNRVFTRVHNYTYHVLFEASYLYSIDGGMTWLPCGVMEDAT